ncbi:MAG TPA: hypothetical protein VJZ71_14280 [Phycisphaerae bacterium]|nr:hypothetical protein [Phycisphaerae bacterium]
MKHMTLPMIGIAAFWLSCSQAPPPQSATPRAPQTKSADPVRDSNYVGVSVAGKVPEEVPTLVNTIVAKYVDKVNQLQKDTNRKTGAK